MIQFLIIFLLLIAAAFWAAGRSVLAKLKKEKEDNQKLTAGLAQVRSQRDKLQQQVTGYRSGASQDAISFQMVANKIWEIYYTDKDRFLTLVDEGKMMILAALRTGEAKDLAIVNDRILKQERPLSEKLFLWNICFFFHQMVLTPVEHLANMRIQMAGMAQNLPKEVIRSLQLENKLRATGVIKPNEEIDKVVDMRGKTKEEILSEVGPMIDEITGDAVMAAQISEILGDVEAGKMDVKTDIKVSPLRTVPRDEPEEQPRQHNKLEDWGSASQQINEEEPRKSSWNERSDDSRGHVDHTGDSARHDSSRHDSHSSNDHHSSSHDHHDSGSSYDSGSSSDYTPND